MPILQVRGLTKRFGGLLAVNNVDLTVEQGEIFAMIGPNGAGKTTMFNLIAGLYKPTSGEIIFNGKSVYPVKEYWRTYLPPLAGYYTVASAVRRSLGRGPMPLGLRPHAVTTLGIARTFQNIRLFSYMTAVENVMVGQHPRMHAKVWDALLRHAVRQVRGAPRPRPCHGPASVRRPGDLCRAVRPQSCLWLPAPAGDRPRAGQ